MKDIMELKVWLLEKVRQLRAAGQEQKATDWEARIRRMPTRMSREAINIVWLSAHWELEDLHLHS